ncbi:unnamed protein product [Ilex paraguariensis]|uniref:Transmembrane protein n=1 Tax=Ilex paraguariensis TaxID=185542 RepID=A0ABC8TGY8_9AQUA
MEQGATYRSGRSSSYERLVAIGLTLLAVVSPLYIDKRAVIEPELDEQEIYISSYLPLLLLVLITAIVFSRYLDRSLARFDAYWIHRVGGSSTGIIVVLVVLAIVLKCKASTEAA